jgi:hypothetical protein
MSFSKVISYRLGVATLAIGIASVTRAQDPQVKVEANANSKQDTTIEIRRGSTSSASRDPDFSIVDRQEVIVGDPDAKKPAAFQNWKTACREWQKTLRELNQKNDLLSMNCNKATASKEEFLWTYQSQGTFTLKVRIREKN